MALFYSSKSASCFVSSRLSLAWLRQLTQLVFLVVAISFALVGCRPARTLYGSYRTKQQAAQPGITRIYLDRDGSFYPEASVTVNDAVLDQHLTVQDGIITRILDPGYLHYYFLFHDTVAYQALQRQYGVRPESNRTHEWATLQYAMQASLAKQLNQQLTAETRGEVKPTLVVLVHGFNVNVPENSGVYAPYHEVEKRISDSIFTSRPVHYLEVYWDGHHGSPFSIWTYAQANAPLVGLTLRGFLSQVNTQFPVRILTHSLGATVATNALWNVRAAKGGAAGDELQRWYVPKLDSQPATRLCFGEMRADSLHYATPRHPNLRLASIAPAQPGITYLDFLDRTPAVTDANGWCQRVIIGFNKHDFATNKIVRPLAKANFGLGATSLAVYADEYGKYVWPQTQRTSKLNHTDAYWIDMYPKQRFWTDHSLIKYLQQPPATQLLEWLFSEQSAASVLPTGGSAVQLIPYPPCSSPCGCSP